MLIHRLMFRGVRTGRRSKGPVAQLLRARFQASAASILVAVAMVLSFVGISFSSDVPPLNARLQSIISREAPGDLAVSIQVVDLKSGRILMEKNPGMSLVPASTMKVITTAAALSCLKPDFTFVTEILVDSARAGSVGNLFVRGGGDPHMVTERLFALAGELTDKGLTEIRGDIIVDDSLFVPGKPLDENEKLGPRAYHAPYGALSLNFNSVKLIFHPGARAGMPARIIVDPVSEYVAIEGNVRTVQGERPANFTVSKASEGEGREIIGVRGEIGVQAPPKSRYVNISSPALYTGEVLKQLLLREGVSFEGRVVRGLTPASAQSYLKFDSRPLGTLVYWLNKFSNNFMAEQIALGLGAKVLGSPGTREKGLSVIRQHLLECGVDENQFRLSEASGLSRYNRLSASALVRVLSASSRDFSYNYEFMSSLGVAGIDGTVKDKFSEPSHKRRLRAKTGTLKGVNALAGYGISPGGRLFAFAVLVNSNQSGVGIIDHADRIAKAILDISM